MESSAFRARSMGELLDAAFQVLRARYLQLVTVSLVITSPGIVLRAILPASRIPTIALNFFLTFAAAATVVIVSEAYLGRYAGAGEALSRVVRRFGSIWSAAIVRNLLVIFGLILLVVPGVIAFVVTFAMPAAVMLEGYTGTESFDRSRALARDHWMHVLLTLGVATLIEYLAVFGAGVVLGIVAGADLGKLLVDVVVVMVHPFTAVVATLLYYDLRIRKEGFDIAMLMQSLEPAEAPAPPVPAL